jgi:hypothetical protein
VPLPTPEQFLEGSRWREHLGTERDLEGLRAVAAAAVRHAEGGPRLERVPFEEDRAGAHWETAEGAAWEYYWSTYTLALADRYIRESGVTVAGVASWTWGAFDAMGALRVAPAGPPLLRMDGSPAERWEAWLARATSSDTVAPDRALLLVGLQRIAAAAREDALRAEAFRKHPGHRLGSHAVRSFARSYEERHRAAMKAFRNNKLTEEERNVFISEDATSLKSHELLVAALLLEYARQEGRLRELPAANYRFGPLVLDISFFVSKVSTEQMARDLGGQVDGAGRVDKTFRDTVAGALESMQAKRWVLIEPRLIPSDEDARGKKQRGRVKGEAYAENAPLLVDSTDADGNRAWKVHPALALGYHRAAVYIDRAAWQRGQAHIGARYLDEAFTRADVYFRMLAPAVFKERQDNGDEVTAEAGVSKRLRTATLLDRFGLYDSAKRGQTEVAKRLEKLLGFCIGAGSVIAWERWESTPRRKGAAPELKGYTVRLPVPAGQEAEPPEPMFPELEAELEALGDGTSGLP